MIKRSDLTKKQGMTLNQKMDHTLGSIEQFYNRYDGKVYVCFSGGKDSTVLLDLARRLYPEIRAVFIDTGLEYPEIRDFVRLSGGEFVRPDRSFRWVLEKYGFPIVSKKISMGVSRYRATKSDLQKSLRLYGGINPTSGKKQYATISRRWHFLIDAPFKISEQCCNILKKNPLRKFEKKSGLKPIIGIMAEESTLRVQEYLKHGCNAFEKKNPQSTPIMFWTKKDIWEYIKKYKVPYSEIYNMGYERTGCMFCMFGSHMEKEPNRFQQMAVTHPKQYDYCINKLRLDIPLKFIGVETN